MPTIEQVRRQAEKLQAPGVEKGFIQSFFVTKKEIDYLPKVLDENENLRALCSGFMNGVTWLAVCTDKRIIFLHRGMIFGIKQMQVPLDRVQSIDNQTGLIFGHIRIWDGASAIVVSMVLKQSVLQFVKLAKQAIDEHKRGMIPGHPPAAAPVDIASQLERLAALKEKGVLTEEEFQQQKRKLLA